MTSYFALNRHGCLIVHRGVRKGRELSRRMMEKGINDDWYPIISREDGIICLRVSCHRVWFAFRFRGGIVWCCTASTLVRCCGMRTMVSYSNTHNYGYELRSYLDLPAVHEPPRRKSTDGRCVDAGRFNLTVDRCPIETEPSCSLYWLQ